MNSILHDDVFVFEESLHFSDGSWTERQQSGAKSNSLIFRSVQNSQEKAN